MDQPLEPWVSNGGTGVVAAAFSNQGQAASHGPGRSFFLRICRCYVCDKEFHSGEPGAMAQGKSAHQPSQANSVFQIPAELTWGLPFGGIWRRSVVVDGPEGREG